MRKIPIYDTTNKNEIIQLILEWEEGIVNKYNYEAYKKATCRMLSCQTTEHLEISKQSEFRFGRSIRTASLSLMMGKQILNSESIYQGSKVLANDGNQHHLYDVDGNTSLYKKSKFKSKAIIGIDLFGHQFATSSLSDLHDVVYWLGIEHEKKNIRQSLEILEGNNMFFFSDCYDSPGKNSQSKSFSMYFWRWRRGETVWDFLSDDQKKMLEIIKTNKHNKTEIHVKGKVQMEALF